MVELFRIDSPRMSMHCTHGKAEASPLSSYLLSSLSQPQQQQQSIDVKPAVEARLSFAKGLCVRASRATRRFSNVTAPSSTSETESLRKVEQRTSVRKRLSLPFRRSSQVLTSTITSIDIYYGSLTGMATRLASVLARDVAARGVSVTLQSLEHFDASNFVAPDKLTHTHATVFIVSTHFAGSASPSAEAFSDWLRAVSSSNSKAASGTSSRSERSAAAHEQAAHNVGKSAAAEALALPNQVNGGADDTPNTCSSRSNSPTNSSSSTSSSSIVPTANNNSISNSPKAGACSLQKLRDWSCCKTRSDRTRTYLRGLQYAVFGVGDSAYLTYNAMGKFVDARLRMLGAARLCALGLGDVSDDIDDAFLRWNVALMQRLPIVPHSIRLLAFERETILIAPPQKDSARQLLLLPPRRSSTASNTNANTNAIVRLSPTSFVRKLQPRQQTSVASSEVPSILACNPIVATTRATVVDRFNKPVHLRFRCRFVSQPVAAPLRRLAVSPRGVHRASAVAAVAAMATPAARHTLHARRETVSLQSISLLLPTATASSDQRGAVNATNLLEDANQVALVRIALLDDDVRFECADTFSYLPQNSSETVVRVAASLGYDLDAWIELYAESARLPARGNSSSDHVSLLPFSSPCTVRTALTEFLELNSVSREFLRVASGYVDSDSERDVLEQLASTDGSDAFAKLFTAPYKGILELLTIAPSLAIPLEVFVNLVPLIKPRLFSIASTHLTHARQIELVVNLGRADAQQGLSATYLCKLLAEQQRDGSATQTLFRACITRSAFKTPVDVAVPMVLIASGVGIAPMRALLTHRKLTRACATSNNPVASSLLATPSLLFYSCKNAQSILFEDELRAFERDGLVTLFLSFSDATTDSTSTNTSVLLQDVVAQHLPAIVATTSVHNDTRVYVCGATSMVRHVRQTLQAYNAPTIASANDTMHWFDAITSSGRFVHDAFS